MWQTITETAKGARAHTYRLFKEGRAVSKEVEKRERERVGKWVNMILSAGLIVHTTTFACTFDFYVRVLTFGKMPMHRVGNRRWNGTVTRWNEFRHIDPFKLTNQTVLIISIWLLLDNLNFINPSHIKNIISIPMQTMIYENRSLNAILKQFLINCPLRLRHHRPCINWFSVVM